MNISKHKIITSITSFELRGVIITQWAQIYLNNIYVKLSANVVKTSFFFIIFVDPFLHYLNVVIGYLVQACLESSIL